MLGKNNKIIDVFIFEGISESINENLDAIKKIDLKIYEVRRSEMSLEDLFFKAHRDQRIFTREHFWQ